MPTDPRFQQSKGTVLLLGATSIILGLVFLTNPTGSTLMITRIVGWVVVAAGVATIVTGSQARSSQGTPFDLVTGIIVAVLGLIVAINPRLFMSWIFVLVGVGILFSGLRRLLAANALRNTGAQDGTAATIFAVVVIILGIVVIISPLTLASLGGTIAGVILLVNGVSEIVRAFRMP